jgi:patatin-like phospholipase/acyl hydrolase
VKIGPARSSFSSTVRRERLPWPSDRTFKILSIDGGGIKGIFPAAVMAELERKQLGGRSIAKYFDLIVGTSTGGILALGLGAQRTSGDLLSLYMDDGKKIFPPGKIKDWLRQVRGVARYKYDRDALETALATALTDRLLADSKSRLCVPAFEGHHSEVYIFKTPHHPDYRLDGKELMSTVGQATSAAPTFFRSLDTGGYRFVDGGIWANNPIMIGLVDALACFNISPSQVRILSIGCGREPVRVHSRMAAGGLWAWKGSIFAAMDCQSQNAMGQARLLTGPSSVLRLEPKCAQPIALDDWQRASAELPAESERVVNENMDRLQEFLQEEASAATFYWPPK